MEVVGFAFDLLFDDLVGIADAVDDVPAGDAGFDRDEGERDIAEVIAYLAHELFKEDEHFFRMAAVAEVVVAGVHDDRGGMEGGDEAIEEPHAGGEGRAAEA